MVPISLRPGRLFTCAEPGFGWSVVALVVLGVVIVPFALFEASILGAVNTLTGSGSGRLAIALTIALLLASDVFLPIPSSVLATLSGSRWVWARELW